MALLSPLSPYLAIRITPLYPTARSSCMLLCVHTQGRSSCPSVLPRASHSHANPSPQSTRLFLTVCALGSNQSSPLFCSPFCVEGDTCLTPLFASRRRCSTILVHLFAVLLGSRAASPSPGKRRAEKRAAVIFILVVRVCVCTTANARVRKCWQFSGSTAPGLHRRVSWVVFFLCEAPIVDSWWSFVKHLLSPTSGVGYSRAPKVHRRQRGAEAQELLDSVLGSEAKRRGKPRSSGKREGCILQDGRKMRAALGSSCFTLLAVQVMLAASFSPTAWMVPRHRGGSWRGWGPREEHRPLLHDVGETWRACADRLSI